MSDAPDTPLAAVDPDSVSALLLADPSTLPPDGLNALIAEFRRRADVAASERAAAEAAPKASRSRSRKGEIADAAVQLIIDKPVSELSASDLFASGLGGLDD